MSDGEEDVEGADEPGGSASGDVCSSMDLWYLAPERKRGGGGVYYFSELVSNNALDNVCGVWEGVGGFSKSVHHLDTMYGFCQLSHWALLWGRAVTYTLNL